MLTSEQLWFIGAVSISNKTSAIFWPVGSYPVKEESLRQFELTDHLLNDLPDRKTKAGEKIGGESDVNVLARINKAKLAKELQSNLQKKTDELNAGKKVPRLSSPPQAPELPTSAQSSGQMNSPKPLQSGNVEGREKGTPGPLIALNYRVKGPTTIDLQTKSSGTKLFQCIGGYAP